MSNDNCSDSALCTTSTKEKFWLDDPSELYKNFNYTKFVPRYEMTRNQQLNAISRFCIYLIILILAFNRGESILILPITILIIVILFKKFNNEDIFGKYKELAKILNIRKDNEDHIKKLKSIEYSQDGDPNYKTNDELDADVEKNKNYKLQAGYYDADNHLNIGIKQKPSCKQNNDSLYTVDEMINYEKNTCRKPTVDNPFMNTAAVEYGSENPPAACNANDEDIKENIKVNFNKDLFRDVDDLWEKMNSQRQFYTMPNTGVPNNQTEFAKWLYKLPDSSQCKIEQGDSCLRYDDLAARIR